MTQLVGAICEDGQKVVTVSDRMVSTGDMTLAWEQPRIKALRLTEKAVVLTAGTVHEPDLLRKAQERAKGRELILEIAEIIKKVYQEAREKEVVDQVLIPKAGIKSFDEWHDKQAKLHFSIVEEIQNGIKHCSIGSTLLLAGVDTEGHLIVIDDPGAYTSWDNMSFCCIGMGERHADNVFAWYKYTRSLPINSALYIAFEAKKRAELAGGVGKSTDIHIIDKDGIKEVNDTTKTRLEEIYHEREAQSNKAGADSHIGKLEIQTN